MTKPSPQPEVSVNWRRTNGKPSADLHEDYDKIWEEDEREDQGLKKQEKSLARNGSRRIPRK